MFEAILENTKIKVTLVACVAAVLLYLLTGSWLNNLKSTDKIIQANWVSLKQVYERRKQLLPQFLQVIQYFAPQATDLQRALSKAYDDVNQVPLSDKILIDNALMIEAMKRQMALANVLGMMETQVTQYPAVEQNRQFLMLNMELQSMEQQIEYHTALLNQNVMIYNSFLTGYPKNWLNSLFLKAKQKQILPLATLKRALVGK